jgi:hypothetical protein
MARRGRNMEEKMSNFIKASDVLAGPLQLVIKKVDEIDLGDGLKDLLLFEGHAKGLILNKTNTGTLIDALGAWSEDWEGKTIELYKDQTRFGAKIVPCVRVRIPEELLDDDEEEEEEEEVEVKAKAKTRKRKAKK